MHEREEIEYTGKNCVFEIGGISDLAYPGKNCKFTDGEKADITKQVLIRCAPVKNDGCSCRFIVQVHKIVQRLKRKGEG